ncbi:MAG: ATP-dependent sacrificial sulfur transferase LarE [Candidatus Nezhaarchaeales archaeon]
MREDEALKLLLDWFKGRGKVAVLLSGGVDSSVVTAAAKRALGDAAVAITVRSITLPPDELEAAKNIANLLGVKHVVIDHDELKDPEFVKNPPNRCYYCKKGMLVRVKEAVKGLEVEQVVDGTNADDLKGYRPGALALLEEGVRSPLAELGIGKSMVRRLAKSLNLPNADKPSMACLASRFPYNQPLNLEALVRVAKAELKVRELVGVKQVRVRDHAGVARIEVGRDERKLFFNELLMDAIYQHLKALGFIYVTLDLAGYREGSLNEALNKSSS